MKLKDFIVEKKQVLIEGSYYNYEVIDMEQLFAEIISESPANFKCIGNLPIVTKLLSLIAKNPEKTLALADLGDAHGGTTFTDETSLNNAIAHSLQNATGATSIMDKLKIKFPKISELLKWTNPKYINTKEVQSVIAKNCDFTKEVIKLTKSTFITVWKDENSHIPGEAA